MDFVIGILALVTSITSLSAEILKAINNRKEERKASSSANNEHTSPSSDE